MKDSAKSKFVILSQPRTGTNAFVARLNLAPGIACHYELFHHRKIFCNRKRLAALDDFDKQLLEKSYRNKHPLEFLDRLADLSQDYIFGFKLFFWQNETIRAHVLDDLSWKKIITFRANLLDQYLSKKIAEQTKAWTFKEQEGKTENAANITFDYPEFQKFVNNEREILNHYVSRAEGDTFLLEYNSAVKGDLKQLTEWLGKDTAFKQSGKQILKKQNPTLTEKKVGNFDVLVSCLEGTEFEWMIVTK